MPVYEQVVDDTLLGPGAAGNVDGKHVYKIVFGTNGCSDMPQLQAWDDYHCNSTTIESLAGTTLNGGKSQIGAAHTTNINTGGPWLPTTASAGGGVMQDPNAVGTSHRANRLRGAESYLLLGDVGDDPPLADTARLFQLAFAAHSDNVVGSAGHMPVLAVKTFYAGAAPVVGFHYNNAADDTLTGVGAVWIAMTSADKGSSMAVGVKNTIHATGPDTTVSSLDPVTKPGSGEKCAEEQWIQTAV